MTEEELDHLDFEQLEKKMQESLRALEIIRTFYQTGSMSGESHQALKRIRIAKEFQTEA
jgi:hypothetical protein